MLGITEDTVDPPGGHIDRSHDDNHVTGLLFENVLDVVNAKASLSDDQLVEYIDQSLRTIMYRGVTSVQACELDTWPLFCRLVDQGRLPVRVFYTGYYVGAQRLPTAGETRGQLLHSDRIKLFGDGALGVATAAMSRPYVGQPDNTGMLLLSQVKSTLCWLLAHF